MKLTYFRVAWKRLLSRFFLVSSFCKQCGVDVRDFIAPEEAWERVHIATGVNVLCYQCFADVCAQLGVDPVWQLTQYNGKLEK